MAGPVLGGMFICRPKPLSYRPGRPVVLQLMSDLHIGAPQVDYKRIARELAAAEKADARILINGDVLDLIVASDRKRFTMDCVHPRLRGRKDTVGASIDWATEILAPHAHRIDVIGMGNHEASIEKYHGVDPLSVLVSNLRRAAAEKDPDHVLHYGGYTGFVDYRFRCTKADGSPSNVNDFGAGANGRRYVIYYHHGSGGAAPVTKGLIDFNRKDTFIDADVIWMGHKHNRLAVSVEKLSCPLAGHGVNVREVKHIMTGAYMRTYVGQSQESVARHGRRSNYAADMGLAPQGCGGARLLVTFSTGRTGETGRTPPKVQVLQ